jgi:dipeptidyl aminopeptidase/acylaminoacyl peptidase
MPWRIVAVGAAVFLIAVVLLRLLLPSGTTGSLTVSTVGSSQTGQITVSGVDFAPAESVDIALDGAVVKTVTTEGDGTFTTQIGIGDKMGGVVSVVGGTSGRQADTAFTVAPISSSNPTASHDASVSPSQPASPTASDAAPSATTTTASTSPGILFYSDRAPGSTTKGANELYLIDPVTRVETRLTDNTTADSFPAWSPDHKRIVFDRDGDLLIAAFAGGTLSTKTEGLTKGTSADSFPAWSVDDWFAFVRTRSSTDSEIRRIQRGKNSVPFVAGQKVRAPAWSPDGKTLAYMADNGSGQYDIYTVKVGEAPVPLLDSPVSELNPNWSPDGKTIVFVRDHGEPLSYDNDIYTVDVATKTVSGPLTGTSAYNGQGVQDGNPVWSPDGKQIAFYRALEASPTTGYHLWLMNADGSGQQDLMPDRPGRNLDPMWR